MFMEIILSLLTISFFATFALRPTALTITQLLQDIKAKEEVVDQLDKKIADLAKAQSVYQQNAPRLTSLNQSLPDEPQPEAYARQIEGLATRHGVNLNSMVMDDVVLVGEVKTTSLLNPNIAALPAGAGEINFSLNVIGVYSNLTSFLSDLENLRRILKIDHTSISVAQVEEGKTLTLTVNGRIPYHK